MTDRVRVLYIAGAGRSGTTLLDCMLGQLPGVVSAGEVTNVWERGLVGNELCGCGQRFRRCRFWSRVVERALCTETPEPRLLGLRDRVCRLPNLPRILYPALRSRRFDAEVDRYAGLLQRVYAAIRDVSGCQFVVDSSKYPPEACLLREIPGIQPFLVHMVRNANAVAYAWKKRTWRPEVQDRPEPMPRYPALQTAIAWNVFNSVIERLGRQGLPYVRIRYEDLVRRPRQSIAGVCELIGHPEPDLSFIGEGEVHLGPNHTVSGNPIRLSSGQVRLVLDREWEERASRLQKVLVSGLTLAQLRRYGYLRPPSARGTV